ncbi:MAG TPA: diacylglycerol kinase family protein [Bryobacteraceae bacterium]|nr:diacylglycerol kinase family protein [Bryobacteraceae bacterium]
MDSFHARRAALIYNPVARALSRNPHSLQRTTDLLSQQGVKTTLVPTTGPGSATVQARRQIDEGCDLIIVAGGDGTINEAANGMLHTPVPLAILPGGTANVLAREMQIPTPIDHAAKRLSQWKPRRIAVGRLQRAGDAPRSFLCMAGAGLDADIVARLNLDLKAATGKFAYYVAGFSHVLSPLKEFEVLVDGRRFDGSFALISRVRNYGGDLEIARGASLLGDRFEVVLFRGTMSVRYLPYLLGVALGRAHQMHGCTVVRGSSVVCRPPDSSDIYVQVDGELAGTLPATADIIPNALTLLMPPEYLAREQSFAAVPACA